MPNVVAALYHDLTSPDTNPPEWALSGRNWITILMIVLVPLAFLRKLDSLRHTSYIALFSVGTSWAIFLTHLRVLKAYRTAYLVVVVIWCYFFPLEGTMKPGPRYLVHFTPSFVSTFPVQVFAYTCAQNVGGFALFAKDYVLTCIFKLFPIFNEISSNTQERMNIVVGTSIGSAALIYEVIAVFGYLTFGSKVRLKLLISGVQ